jgi:hypothetical protein
VDQHGAASGVTGILDGEGPAIRCANGPLHASTRAATARGQRRVFFPSINKQSILSNVFINEAC